MDKSVIRKVCKSLLLLLLLGACKKNNIIPVPVVSAGPDLELQAPMGTIELDASETLKKNPVGDGLNLSWKVISQPFRSQEVKIDQSANSSSASSKTYVSGLSEGVYQFQLSANFDQGPMASDTMELRIRPDPGNAKYLTFSNLVWEIYGNQIPGEYASYINIKGSFPFLNNGNFDSNILIWDYVKKDWLKPGELDVDMQNGGLRISSYSSEYFHLMGNKAWILIKI